MEFLLLLADMIKDLDPAFNSTYINFIDRSDAKNVGIFQQESSKINTFGGSKNRGYSIRPLRILIRYGENSIASYEKAKLLYDYFDNYEIDSHPPIRYFGLLDDEPIFIGREENVVEYVIRVNVLLTH